jgi:hypothetical protein
MYLNELLTMSEPVIDSVPMNTFEPVVAYEPVFDCSDTIPDAAVDAEVLSIPILAASDALSAFSVALLADNEVANDALFEYIDDENEALAATSDDAVDSRSVARLAMDELNDESV